MQLNTWSFTIWMDNLCNQRLDWLIIDQKPKLQLVIVWLKSGKIFSNNILDLGQRLSLSHQTYSTAIRVSISGFSRCTHSSSIAHCVQKRHVPLSMDDGGYWQIQDWQSNVSCKLNDADSYWFPIPWPWQSQIWCWWRLQIWWQ